MDSKDVNRRAQRKPQEETKHPPQWRQDLNPDHLAGQNIVPKDEVPYPIWDRLIGEEKPARRMRGPAEDAGGAAADR
jgi:hypothetical protein